MALRCLFSVLAFFRLRLKLGVNQAFMTSGIIFDHILNIYQIKALFEGLFIMNNNKAAEVFSTA